MRIQDVTGAIKSTDQRDLRRSDQAANRPDSKPTKSADGDTLDLSLSARVSELSDSGPGSSEAVSAELTPERISEIRSRLATGFYTQPQLAETTADRILTFYGR